MSVNTPGSTSIVVPFILDFIFFCIFKIASGDAILFSRTKPGVLSVIGPESSATISDAASRPTLAPKPPSSTVDSIPKSDANLLALKFSLLLINLSMFCFVGSNSLSTKVDAITVSSFKNLALVLPALKFSGIGSNNLLVMVSVIGAIS